MAQPKLTKEEIAKRLADVKAAMGAEGSPLVGDIPADAGGIRTLFSKLYDTDPSKAAIGGMFANDVNRPGIDDFIAKQAKFKSDPLNSQTGALRNTLNLAKSNISAHPYASFGTALNASGNIAGLLDNDKVLGQGIGAVIGGLGGKMFNLGPLGMANAAMVGGNLGALFDNLRAKKEREQAYAQYQ